MSRWQDIFKQHQVHTRIKNIQTILRDKALKKLDADVEQEVSRIKKCVNLVNKILSSADQELVTQAHLDQINQQLTTLEQHLNNFKSNQSMPELQAANNYIDQILNILSAMATVSLPPESATEVSVNSLIERGEEFLETLDERKKELQQQIAGLKTSATHLETRLGELQARIDEKIAALDQLSNEWIQQFSDSQNEREKRFSELMSKIELASTTQTNAIVDKLSKAVSKKQKTYEEKIDSYLSDATDRHEKIRKLHGLIAEDSITGGHKKSADGERKTANFWRGFSVFFLFLAAAWLGIVFWQTGGISWKASLSGFPLTLVLLSAAGYAAHQSSTHRRQSNRQRQFALEMIAIDPYLETLGEEERNAIKKQLAAQYFGHVFDEQGQKADKDYVMLPGNIPEWLAKIITKGDAG